jgi:hypothetical protein
MKYRSLGKSGIEASVVGFGAWAIGGWKGATIADHRVRAPRLLQCPSYDGLSAPAMLIRQLPTRKRARLSRPRKKFGPFARPFDQTKL